MTKQDFIFSDVRKYRLVRHITFWVVWWLVYFLFFHLPQHAVHGWNLSEANANLQENGAWWILKMLIFNSLLAVVVPQMLLTYTLLYYILPKYFYKKNHPFVIAIALVLVVFAYLMVSGCFKILAILPNYVMGLRKTFPWPNEVSFIAAFRDTLTSLPIIVGTALAIKLIKNWWVKEKETQQIAGEKIKAELQLLKAQVHPHFLFNTLNNIYYFTLTGSTKAPEMIKKLSDLLNYILNECQEQWVPLEKELKMIEDYVSLEKIRYGEQMDLSVDLPNLNGSDLDKISNWCIAPLLLIPFVENSFKHGVSKMLSHQYVNIRIAIEENKLHVLIANSCPYEGRDIVSNGQSPVMQGNIGLKNVKQRLQLLYPNKHKLSIIPDLEQFTVQLQIQLHKPNDSSRDIVGINSNLAYERT